MKRIFHTIMVVATVLCHVSCTGQKKEAAAYMLRPHEELPAEVAGDRSFTKIFLAGTIDMGNSEDWQTALFERFSEADGRFILFNPRQEHWDASRPGEMDYQVNWELEHLEEADIIIMNIIGSSQSPISLLEMGLHAREGKLHVVCEASYYRYDNVRITCSYYGIPLYSSLDELIGSIGLPL